MEVFDEHVHIVIKGHIQEKGSGSQSLSLFSFCFECLNTYPPPFSPSHFIVYPLLQILGSVSNYYITFLFKIKVICVLKIFIYVEYIKIILIFIACRRSQGLRGLHH